MAERDLHQWVELTRRNNRRTGNRRFPENRRFLKDGADLVDELRREESLPTARRVATGPSPFPGVSCEVISRPAAPRLPDAAFAPEPADRQAPRLIALGTTIAAVLFIGVIGMMFTSGPESQPVAKRPISAPSTPEIEKPMGEILATSGGAEID